MLARDKYQQVMARIDDDLDDDEDATKDDGTRALIEFGYSNECSEAEEDDDGDNEDLAASHYYDADGDVEEESLSSRPDAVLSVRLAPMRFVYLQQFWLEIIDYVFEGILGDAIYGTVRSANAFLEQSVASKTAFSVDVQRPVIVFPRHCRRQERLEATLGDLTVRSKFSTKTVTVFRKPEPEVPVPPPAPSSHLPRFLPPYSRSCSPRTSCCGCVRSW